MVCFWRKLFLVRESIVEVASELKLVQVATLAVDKSDLIEPQMNMKIQWELEIINFIISRVVLNRFDSNFTTKIHEVEAKLPETKNI
jgi:hypothetical protein